jgi:predicted RNA binding protein YcfA (HicA-like mRNA interferase family)
LVVRKPAYIDCVKAIYNEGKGTDDWAEEALANVHGYEQCVLRMKRILSESELNILKRTLLRYIQRMPPGDRNAKDMISISGPPKKDFNVEENKCWEKIHNRYLPFSRSYNPNAWCFGYFDYPLGKINGRINFLVPKKSPISDRISLNGRFLSTKEIVKKLTKSVGLKEIRKGKGSHTRFQASNGNSTTIPLQKNDMPIGTLKSILKDLGLKTSIHEFLKK